VRTRAFGLACAVALVAAPAAAQTVSGLAEWTVSNGSSTSDERPYSSQSFWQRYNVRFGSALLDPRFLKYDADVTFRTNSLTFGHENLRHGTSNDLGYTLGASLFPARPFPFAIQASRNTIRESGDYPSSAGIRGSLVVPTGDALPDFQMEHRTLSMSWQLVAPGLPRVELSYRTSSAEATGGPFRAEQNDVSLHASISRDTSRTRQALRFQQTETSNLVSQAFNHEVTDLSYDFAATLSRRNRFTLRVGHRTTWSLFDVPADIVDPGTGAYLLPSRGSVDARYALTGITFEPNRRFAVDLTASLHQQHASDLVTGARLLASSVRVEPVRGLSLVASGTYGERDQTHGTTTIGAVTRNVQAGASYRVGVGGLDANIGYRRRLGSNTTPDGVTGELQSWSGQAGLSLTVRGTTVGGGYERTESEDEILDFGNYDTRRQFLNAQTRAGRVMVAASWDDTLIRRGRDLRFSQVRQQTFTASVSAPLGRTGRLTANAGGFSNRAAIGHDETVFWGGSIEAQVAPRLVLTLSARYDELISTGTSLAQQGLAALAKIDYRLRSFTFSLEYHHNEQHLSYLTSPDDHRFRGHQVLLRISRKFGLRL